MEAAGRADFGTLLRQLRLDAGMTQQELAERAHLSVEAIGQLERGARTRPQRETVALLLRALDLPAERQALLSVPSVTHVSLADASAFKVSTHRFYGSCVPVRKERRGIIFRNN